MQDGGRIVGGVILSLLFGAGPAWISSVRAAGPRPQLSAPVSESRCISPAYRMRLEHPALLAEWRQQAVRGGERFHQTEDGRMVRISLNGTCLGCHGSAAGFCERCHQDVGVSITCWGCHSTLPGSP
jgi:hypothetical protein